MSSRSAKERIQDILNAIDSIQRRSPFLGEGLQSGSPSPHLGEGVGG
jgi:hypothetical protein